MPKHLKLNPILILPLAQESHDVDFFEIVESHPVLPFAREFELQDEVIKLLMTPTIPYAPTTFGRPVRPHFSLVPAIRHVKAMTGWFLVESKAYVDKIYSEYAGQIDAARVEYFKRWDKKQETEEKANGRI